MNLNSKYFDRIRINPAGSPAADADAPRCEWHGCDRPGGYRAPKGRSHEGEYHKFCLDHVREYNRSYNYFAGMADADIAAFQRSAATGHRPTWSIGVNGFTSGDDGKMHSFAEAFVDPFGFFGGAGARAAETAPESRPLNKLERRSFEALNLEGTETADEIRSRYKELVKRLHPDANGGDRSSEDRLGQIIQAYQHLKSVGFC